MHWMSFLGLILITLGGILSFYGTYYSDKNNQSELTEKIQAKDSTIENINSSNVKLIQINSELLDTSKNVAVSNNELIVQNEDMLMKITNYQTAIEEKNLRIKELEEKVSKSERGIESKIQYDGTHRERQGATININTETIEHSYYKKMMELNGKNDWVGLLTAAEESITKNKKWFTSYIFKAYALLWINEVKNKQKALDLLDFVLQNTAGDMDYVVPVIDILIKLNEKSRLEKIITKLSIGVIQTIQNEDLKNKIMKIKTNAN